LQHPMEDSGGVSLGEKAGQPVDVMREIIAGLFVENHGQRGLFVEHVERGLSVGNTPCTVPVIGIGDAPHALESIGAIPNVGVCAVAEEIAVQVVGQGRAALRHQLIS